MIKERLNALRERINELEKKYHREKNSVRLLAASKKQSIEKIQMLIDLGQHVFGENYLQEALAKMSVLDEAELEWHFIGPIQSNKTKKMAEHFAWVQSVDNSKIAQRLNDQRPLHLPPLNICIEVNTSHEASKSGVEPSELKALAEYCQSLPRIRLRGLMTIPAPTAMLEEQRKPFRQLAQLLQTLNQEGYQLDTLSMGMSDDYEAAIAEGSTLLRIGTRLFGARE